MGEDKNTWFTVVKGVLVVAGMLVTGLATLVWRDYEATKLKHDVETAAIREKMEKDNSAIHHKLAELSSLLTEVKNERDKWMQIARNEKDVLDLRQRVEVMRQVWSYEYGREVPTGFPSKIGKPLLKAPERLIQDIDRYRNMKQQAVQQALER